ncbi:hypothetical protein CE91St44_29870 [Oscillospiraceae bacterium]|uniref:ribbon-helix-helix protein, CopG family n=1 Tax=Allofournierella sp. TaxID=1940256 RepID=UPI0015B3252F|nr:hypothetical protein CE91St44_29870 [Oscillospiraceae bacterium]
MDELKISRRTEPVMFTIRIDRSVLEFYDRLARATNRSRNELLGLALDYAKDKFLVEGGRV